MTMQSTDVKLQSTTTAPSTRPGAAQAGVSLMEVLLVIAIVAFLVVGGLTLFTQAQQQGSAQRAQQQLSNLSSSIRGAFAGQPTYTGLDQTTLFNLNAVPDDMDGGDGNIYNAFGAQVAVDVGGNCGQDPRNGTAYTAGYFCVDFPGLTEETCQRLVSANIGADSIGPANGTMNAPPIDVTEAQQICTQGQNTIRWVFAG